MQIILDQNDLAKYPQIIDLLFGQQQTEIVQPVVTVETEPTFSLEDIKKAAAKLISSIPEMKRVLQELNATFGVKSITELSSEQLTPYGLELRGLGAQI